MKKINTWHIRQGYTAKFDEDDFEQWICPESGEVLVIESITHVWREILESYLRRVNRKRLMYHDWGPIKTTWGEYINSQLHCVVCGRAGNITEQHQNDLYENCLYLCEAEERELLQSEDELRGKIRDWAEKKNRRQEEVE